MSGACDFGGDDEGFSFDGLVLHPVADPFFCYAGEFFCRGDGVDFCGVEEVNAAFYGGVHDVVAFFFVGLGAKGHGSETDVADDYSTFP